MKPKKYTSIKTIAEILEMIIVANAQGLSIVEAMERTAKRLREWDAEDELTDD